MSHNFLPLMMKLLGKLSVFDSLRKDCGCFC